jgi:hypothetical protein
MTARRAWYSLLILVFKPSALTYAMKELCLREGMEGKDKMVFE